MGTFNLSSSALLLEYLGSSGGCQSVCNSLHTRSVANFGCENIERKSFLLDVLSQHRGCLSNFGLLSVTGLEAYVTASDNNFYHVFGSTVDALSTLKTLAVASLLGIIVGSTAVWIEKKVSYFLRNSSAIIGNERLKYLVSRVTSGLKQPVYYLLIEAQQVEGIAEPVVVNLEKSYICTSPEAEHHDFEAELAVAKGLSKQDVKNNLVSLHERIEKASVLFTQIEKILSGEATTLLKSEKLSNVQVTRFVKDSLDTYRLSVDAYGLLLEIVEFFWDYSSPQMRREFTDKAQEILKQEVKKINIDTDLPREEDRLLNEIQVKLSTKDGEIFERIPFEAIDQVDINTAIKNALEFYNRYIDISEKFAESVLTKIGNDSSLQNDEPLKLAKESFCQGWYEALTGQTIPLSELWDGIDLEE